MSDYIKPGSTTIDAGDFIRSPAQAAATGLIDGAHVPRDALARWLRKEAQATLVSTGRQERLEHTATKLEQLADRIEHGEDIE